MPWGDLREPSPARVKKWLKELPEANWAVKTGPASDGLAVVDVDTPNVRARGYATWDKIRLERRARFYATPWHETVRGWHFYFKLRDTDLRDLPPRLVWHEGDITIEILIRDHLALIPPSQVNGFAYTWRLPPGPPRRSIFGVPLQLWPPPAPWWLLDWINKQLPHIPRPSPRPSPRPRTVIDRIATDERLIRYIHRLAGREYPGIGKSFRCILPGHTEQHPSAAWWRGEDGKLWLHDFHRRDGREWWGLAEVFASLQTGEARRLHRWEVIPTLADLAQQAGVLEEHVGWVTTQWRTLFQEVQGALRKPTYHHIVGCVGSQAICRVADAFFRLFEGAAHEGRLWVVASKRFLSNATGYAPWIVNRASNALALLRVVTKLPPPPKADRYWATRWVLNIPDPTEFRRRWARIEGIPLRELNRQKAAELFGEEEVSEVFVGPLALRHQKKEVIAA